jgi:hypothetical protein
MKAKRIIFLSIEIVLILVCGGLVFLYGTPYGATIMRKIEQHNLLHGTDHHKLLRACREVIENPDKYEFICFANSQEKTHFFEISTMPEIIQGLGVTAVGLGEDSSCLSIELHGGFDHYGVVAFPKDVTSQDPSQGSVELVPGLWYYSDDNENQVRREQGTL